MAATRLKHHPRYEGLAYIGIASGRPRWTGEIRLNHDLLERPLHWKKPRMIFTCSMSDLFHEDVPFRFIDRIFHTVELGRQHTLQILTKRPKRMLEYMTSRSADFPLPNAWFGVSVENPDYLWRVEELLKIPAAVRFVSLEPMLESINLHRYLGGDRCTDCGHHMEAHQYMTAISDTGCGICDCLQYVEDWPALSWVILGAESGPNRRPFNSAWALDIYEQCRDAGIPFFGKQDSGLHPGVPLLLGGREVKEWPL